MKSIFSSDEFPTLLTIWGFLGLAAAAAVHPQGPMPPPEVRFATSLGWGCVVGMGSRFGFFLRSARTGKFDFFDTAPTYRIWKFFPMSLCFGAASACLSYLVPFALQVSTGFVGSYFLELPLVSLVVVTGVFFVFNRDKEKKMMARHTSFLKWIWIDTALPVGCISALLGCGISTLRFWGLSEIGPRELTKHLAFTFMVYGVCLGTVGYLKAYSERKSKLVYASGSATAFASPVVVGATLAVAVIWLVPHIDQPILKEHLLLTKGCLGFGVGSCLCALGALRGVQRDLDGEN